MFNIRDADAQDFSAILKLMKNELGYPDLIEDEAFKRLEYFKNSNDWATFVASIDDQIVGFIGIMKDMTYSIEGYYSQIMALAVSNNARRKGVGAALVKKAEEWSLSNGITDIGVNCNIRRLDAHKFYETLGYTRKSFSFSKILGK